MKRRQRNPLLCDTTKGACEVPAGHESVGANRGVAMHNSAVKIIYFTDPICSACWGVEAPLRRLHLEYGQYIDMEYRMGGLLRDWNYNHGGISKPADVAKHWDEMSLHYDMPMDGNVWLEDPLHSSYPPCIAFKAAQMQDKKKAIRYLRTIREFLLLEKKNITKWEYLASAADFVGLDVRRFAHDYRGKAKALFQDDLMLAREMGVRGLPTFFFLNRAGQKAFFVGAKPYAAFEDNILALCPTANKNNYNHAADFLFDTFSTLSAREFSMLSGMARPASGVFLEKLCRSKKIAKKTTKNGAMYAKIRDSR